MNNVSILPYNTFGIDATARTFIEYDTEDQLLQLISDGSITTPYLHIGGGSNLLFVTDHYDGTLLHSRIKGIEVVAEDEAVVTVRVGAGEVWDDFVAHCVGHGWYGAENLSLIPGEVGAAAVQNIGAYGVEAKDLIVRVEGIDMQGRRRRYEVADCAYAYRDSLFKRHDMKDFFVTYVTLRLSKIPVFKLEYGAIKARLGDATPTLPLVRDVIMAIRREKLPDPKLLGNAGSFFTNPVIPRVYFDLLHAAYPDAPHYDVDDSHVKVPAAWLIEKAGWKGRSLGPAAVHDKQALVLVNKGGTTGADIVRLAQAVQADVKALFYIDIQPEVNFIY